MTKALGGDLVQITRGLGTPETVEIPPGNRELIA